MQVLVKACSNIKFSEVRCTVADTPRITPLSGALNKRPEKAEGEDGLIEEHKRPFPYVYRTFHPHRQWFRPVSDLSYPRLLMTSCLLHIARVLLQYHGGWFPTDTWFDLLSDDYSKPSTALEPAATTRRRAARCERPRTSGLSGAT